MLSSVVLFDIGVSKFSAQWSFLTSTALMAQSCFPFKTRRLPSVLVGPRVVSFANPLSAGSEAGNLSCPRVDYGLVLQPPLGLIPKTGGAQNVLNPAFGNQYLGLNFKCCRILVFQFLKKSSHNQIGGPGSASVVQY